MKENKWTKVAIVALIVLAVGFLGLNLASRDRGRGRDMLGSTNEMTELADVGGEEGVQEEAVPIEEPEPQTDPTQAPEPTPELTPPPTPEPTPDQKSGDCGPNLKWAVNNGVLEITGSGDMNNYSFGSAPWYEYSSEINTITISSDCTSIGNYAFVNCSNLTKVDLSNATKLKVIGDGAFTGESNLNSIDFSKCSSLNKIGTDCFASCTKLTKIDLLNCKSLTTIGDNAFRNCSSVTTLNLPGSVTSLGTNICASTSISEVFYNGARSQWAKVANGDQFQNVDRFEVGYYDVTFDSQGGSAVAAQIVARNGNVQQPANPTKAGSNFGGWYTEAECTNAYNFSSAVTGEITLYAKWEGSAKIAVQAPGFANVTYGDQAGVQAITIQNTGSADAVVSNISLTGNGANAFNLTKTGGATIPAGGTDTSYGIQPKAGIGAGTYAATINVEYNGGTESANVQVVVDKRAVTVTNILGVDKTYDGNNSAKVDCSKVSINNKVGSDNLTVSASGVFTDVNEGTSKEIKITGISLGGNSAGNYVLDTAHSQATTTARINRANIVVRTNDVSCYVGEKFPDLSYKVTGLVGNDKLQGSVSYTIEAKDTSKAGKYKVTPKGLYKPTSNYNDITFEAGTLTIVESGKPTPKPTPTPTPTAKPTPTPTAKPTDPQPYIDGDTKNTGWTAVANSIADKIAKGNKGPIVVDLNNTTTVPAEVFDKFAGKDVVVDFNLGNGYKWSVNGQDVVVGETANVNFAVTANAGDIPADKINAVADGNDHYELQLAHNGMFGFDATLAVSLNTKDAGKYATLLYWNPNTEKFEVIDAKQVDDGGTVKLKLSHASDYTLVVGEEALTQEKVDGQDQPTPEPTVEPEPAPQNTSSPLKWIAIGLGALLIILIAVFINANSRKQKVYKPRHTKSEDEE